MEADEKMKAVTFVKYILLQCEIHVNLIIDTT